MKKILLGIIACIAGVSAFAQTEGVTTPLATPKMNIVKFNLSAAGFGNYTMAYERVLNRKQSVGLAFGYAPNQPLPFKSALLNLFEGNAQAESAINSTIFNTVNVTAEYRFYQEIKGAPFGVYGSTFIRYMHMQHEGTYSFNLSDGEHNPFITTTFTGIGAGGMIGVQWNLGKNFALDWWIAGPYVVYVSGSSYGDDNRPVDDNDKIKLEQDIEDIGNSIPGWNVDATVTDNPATGLGDVDAELKGAFYGIRFMGICLGYMF